MENGTVGISLGNFAAEGVITISRRARTCRDVCAAAIWIRNSRYTAKEVIGRVRINSPLRVGGKLRLDQAAKFVENFGGHHAFRRIDQRRGCIAHGRYIVVYDTGLTPIRRILLQEAAKKIVRERSACAGRVNVVLIFLRRFEPCTRVV